MTTPVTPPPDQSPGEIAGPKAIESNVSAKPTSSGEKFQSFMQAGEAPQKIAQGTGPTPMSLASTGAASNIGQGMNGLLAQATGMQDSLGVVGQQLNTPNLKLNRSQTRLLRNKLTNMQEHTRSAADMLGVQTPPAEMPHQGGVLVRFLSYLNDGQDQLVAVQQKLKDLAAKKDQLDPADMMRIQIKLNLAQQEIEFSSMLLSKVVSSITTIMGIQI